MRPGPTKSSHNYGGIKWFDATIKHDVTRTSMYLSDMNPTEVIRERFDATSQQDATRSMKGSEH